jgi:iron complex outermembrane receptor protein
MFQQFLWSASLAALLVFPSSASAQNPASDSTNPQPASGDPATRSESTYFDEVIVTGARDQAPSTVVLDPKAPQQPLPAHDGASLLRTIPGFSQVRKGGIDADPVFRGQAGSRLGIVVDGTAVAGGCGNRMDPPTAYITPTAFDRVEVVKGPQSVRHGGGHSAAVVIFERTSALLDDQTSRGHVALVGGSAERNDQSFDVTFGSNRGTVRAIATRSANDDYRDGDGTTIHSEGERWSADLDLLWRPSDRGEIVLSAGRSDGEAAYADRAMDGIVFDRRAFALRGSWMFASPRGPIEAEARAFSSEVDHVMDNFTLRVPTGPRMASNPTRENLGARALARLAPAPSVELELGASWDRDQHTTRATMNEDMMPLAGVSPTEDAEYSSLGSYAEVTYKPRRGGSLVLGLRADQWKAEDLRQRLGMGMMAPPNPTANATRDDLLWSTFVRWSSALTSATQLSVGLGTTTRFPDYWELFATDRQSETSTSAFLVDPESTTQFDLGLRSEGQRWLTSISVFVADHRDLILLDNRTATKPGITVSRNIDATTWGGEASVVRRWQQWRADATLAVVRGDNRTESVPLAQIPADELRLGLGWDDGTWAAGGLLRLVADQDRVDIGAGSIAGLDLGPSDDFAALSLNGAWRPRQGWLVAVGVDNVLDESYVEHLSRSAAAIPGFDPIARVAEPGRTLWLRLTLEW